MGGGRGWREADWHTLSFDLDRRFLWFNPAQPLGKKGRQEKGGNSETGWGGRKVPRVQQGWGRSEYKSGAQGRAEIRREGQALGWGPEPEDSGMGGSRTCQGLPEARGQRPVGYAVGTCVLWLPSRGGSGPGFALNLPVVLDEPQFSHQHKAPWR